MVLVKKHASVIYIALFAVIVVVMAFRITDRSPQGVVINEICTSNVTNCEDENGDYPDWVELYNPTDGEVDISDYVFYKTSDPKKDRFAIPAGTILASGEYYVFDPKFPMPSSGCDLTLIDPEDNRRDRIYVPKLKFDTTYARRSDGGSDWNIKTPSPGWSNDEEADLNPTVEGTVYASVPSGFYDDEIDLELGSSGFGRQIYYTVDGSDPVKHGVLYDKPLHIRDRSEDDNVYSIIPDVSEMYTSGQTRVPSFPVDKCTVVSAVAKDIFGRYTDVSTFFYYVGFDDKAAYNNMPVVSVMADPDDLFSYEDGIMVLGQSFDRYVEAGSPREGYDDYKANYMQKGRKSERPVDIVIFDEEHLPVLDTKACIRLKGLSSRVDEQKSFNICFHAAVGGSYKEDFAVDGTDYSVHAFSLDKCGQDIDTKMKDTIMEYCMAGTDCTTTHRTPCCLFLNGEYWGFYWIAERFDRSYISDRYGVSKDGVVIKDLTDYEHYADCPVSDFDRNSFIDYYAGNIITAHGDDWPYMNFSFWYTDTDEKTQFGDGKCRPIIFDMNSTSMEDPGLDSFTYLEENFSVFSTMMKGDPAFRKDLSERVDSMCGNEFRKDKVLKMIDDISGRIRPQMILDRMRYFDAGADEAGSYFDEHVDRLRNFYETRYDNLYMYNKAFVNDQ